jgi:hypothetical protein
MNSLNKKRRRGQLIYLPKMFRIDEKMEFKSENSTTRSKEEMGNEARYFIQQENKIPDPY